MRSPVTLEGFKRALKMLDIRLEAKSDLIKDDLPIVIKAIGGFALLYHKIRIKGVTYDIDSVTPDYPVGVSRVIAEVSSELSLEEDWLNNDNAMDVEMVENMIDPFWSLVNWELRNITLYVADLETLLRSKLLASEDDDLTFRVQDYPDLLDILRSMGCKTYRDVSILLEDKMELNIVRDFPRNLKRLKESFEMG